MPAGSQTVDSQDHDLELEVVDAAHHDLSRAAASLASLGGPEPSSRRLLRQTQSLGPIRAGVLALPAASGLRTSSLFRP